MRKFLALLITLILFSSCYAGSGSSPYASTGYVAEHVVMLKGDGGQCTGIQIKAPSGVSYILSAGHCAGISSTNEVMANLDNMDPIPRRILLESPSSDLLLIEGMPGLEGIKIAESFEAGATYKAVTHGLGMATHTAEGKIIDDSVSAFPVFPIMSDEDAARCSKPKNKMKESILFGQICVVELRLYVSTISIEPGSSGGPIVNSRDELTAIATAKDPFFSYLTMLSDIKAFVAPF